MRVPVGMPVLAWVKMPVVKPEAAVQFVVGFTVVPQQVPRAEIEAGIPREVTLAPRVAPVVVIEAAVGEVTVGTALHALGAFLATAVE